MKWERIKRKEKYILIPVYLACYIFGHYTGIGCIFRYISGIPCPGCGFTRSVIKMFELDFPGAWNYHPMFWSSFLIFLYFIFEGEVFSNKVVNRLVFGLICAGFIVIWIIRLIYGVSF